MAAMYTGIVRAPQYIVRTITQNAIPANVAKGLCVVDFVTAFLPLG